MTISLQQRSSQVRPPRIRSKDRAWNLYQVKKGIQVCTVDFSCRDKLLSNYRCESNGWFRIVLLEKIPSLMVLDIDLLLGFTFTECDSLNGSGDRVVTWNRHDDLSTPSGMVGIRIKMFHAKLFAYRL